MFYITECTTFQLSIKEIVNNSIYKVAGSPRIGPASCLFI